MKYFALTDKGLKRENNQDSYCITHNRNNDILMMVCDGVGGANAGDVASATLVDVFSERFSSSEKFYNEEDIIFYIIDEIRNASNEVNDLAKTDINLNGMGTTATGIVYSDLGIFVFNVGDSRVYLNKDSDLIQLTKDHTLFNRLIDEGNLTETEAQLHPQGSYLTNVCGMWQDVIVDVNKLDQDAENILICSDGLHGYVSDEEIKSILNEKLNLQQRTKKLMKAALDTGGFDNITIILCKVVD